MKAIATCLILTAVAVGLGKWLLSRLRWKPTSRAEDLVYSSAIGYGLVAYLVLLLGLTGLLTVRAVLLAGALLLPVAILGWRAVAVEPVGWRDPEAPPGRLGVGGWCTLGLVAAVSLFPLSDCFVPPGAHEWDTLSYHLALPKLYLEQHRIIATPTVHHSNFPFLMQMLFALGLMFDGYAAAKLLHFGAGALTAIGLYLPVRRRLAPGHAILAPAIFVLTPMVVWEAGIAYIDLAHALYVSLAFWALLRYLADDDAPSLGAAGVLSGMALSVKTLSLIPVFAIVLVLLVRRNAAATLRYAVIATVLGCPFYVKSAIMTGNPVYPFAFSVFGGRYWDKARAEAYASEHRSFGLDARMATAGDDLLPVRKPYVEPRVGDRARSIALAPFALVTLPRLFYNYNDPGPLRTMGFLWLALLPACVLATGHAQGLRSLVIILTAWFCVWCLSMQYARYLLPMLPLAAMLAALAAAKLTSKARWLSALVGIALCLQGGVLGAHLISRAPAQWARAGSPDTARQALRREINSLASQEWLNANTDPSDGVVLFEETRTYYLDRRALWGNSPHSAFIPYERFADGAAMVRWFESQAVRFALVNLQFSPRASTQEGGMQLRHAVATGGEAALLLDWYAADSDARESWRRLLGDAVRTGAARVVHDASRAGAVVLQFGAPRIVEDRR